MKFIAFEGLDGAGKSTLIQNLRQHLEDRGQRVKLTREPGGTPLAEELREILIRTHSEAPVPRAELLLYVAGRAQHVDKVIRPALQNNIWVITDRYTASTVAFQNGGRGIPLQEIEWLNQYATEGLRPDLTVLLDLTVEESLKRRQSRNMKTGSSDDRFEKEAQDFHERVRQSYLNQANKNPSSWLILDAAAPTEILFQSLINNLENRNWL